MTNINYFDLTGATCLDNQGRECVRGWWWSADRSEEPTVFNDRGNGPEAKDDGYFGPFSTEAEARADAEQAFAE